MRIHVQLLFITLTRVSTKLRDCFTVAGNRSFVASALAWTIIKVHLDFWAMFGPSPFCPDFLLEELVIFLRVAVFS